jgi:hypothetical protein
MEFSLVDTNEEVCPVMKTAMFAYKSYEHCNSLQIAGQVAQLEREKAELRRELVALQSESSEQQHSTTQRAESPEFSAEKQQEMADVIRQKNRHISQLLNDVEVKGKPFQLDQPFGIFRREERQRGPCHSSGS